MCSASSITLTASGPGGTTYTWSPTTGLNTSSGKTVIANPSVTTTYTVTGTKGSCFNTADATVVPCLTAIGIQNAEALSAINPYPNPAGDILNVNVKNPNLLEIKIILYNTLGENIYQTTGFTENFTINVSDNAAGFYFIKVFSNTELIGNSRITIHK